MTPANRDAQRLSIVLAKDKMKNPARFSHILKKEAEMFLNNFFDYDPNCLAVLVTLQQSGEYDFVIKGKANRIHPCI